MKNLFVFSFCIFLSHSVSSQTFLTENFSGGVMPPAGWTIQNEDSQWSITGNNWAGGIAPECKFTYVNTTTITRLISPPIDLTGHTSVKLMFNHMYDWFANPAPFVGVATRHGNGDWTTVWEVSPDGNIPAETKVIDIANTDVGTADFQFCFYLNGYLYNLDYWYLDDIDLFIPPPLDAALTTIQIPGYVKIGDPVTLTGTLRNFGSDPITSFDIAYSVDGGSPVVDALTGLNISLGETYAWTHNVPLLFNNSGAYHVMVDVQNVNGGTDANPANDTLDADVEALPWLPAKKVFAEEATGTWCGWCVRGICYMDYMAETYPDTWIGVSVHNNDPMVCIPWDAEIPNIIPNFQGYPSGTIDRAGTEYWDPQDFETGYLQRITAFSPATVGIIDFTFNPDTRVVSFNVESEFVIDVYHDVRFCAVITEDSVWGPGPDYDQHNYYAGGGNGPMCGFENLPGTIPATQMHYDYVGRAILDTPYGTAGSIPSPALAGETYSHSYTYTLPAEWVYDKLRFVGLLIDNTTGEILNANDKVIWLGVGEQNKKISLNVYPNPFNTTTNVEFTLDQPQTVGISVVDLLGRTINSEPAKSFSAGQNRIKLDGGQFDNGFYLVKLTIGDKVYTQKVSVAK